MSNMPVGVNKDVIAVLERTLKLAQQSELKSLFLVMEPTNGEAGSYSSGGESVAMMGLVFVLACKVAVGVVPEGSTEEIFGIERSKPKLVKA